MVTREIHRALRGSMPVQADEARTANGVMEVGSLRCTDEASGNSGGGCWTPGDRGAPRCGHGGLRAFCRPPEPVGERLVALASFIAYEEADLVAKFDEAVKGAVLMGDADGFLDHWPAEIGRLKQVRARISRDADAFLAELRQPLPG